MSFYYDWYFGSTVRERAENMASPEWQLRYRIVNRNEFRALPQELENGAEFDDERHRFMEMFTSISEERDDTTEVFCLSQHYELDYNNYEDFYTLVLNQPIRELKACNEEVKVLSCNCPYVEFFEAECKHMVLFDILYKDYLDSEECQEQPEPEPEPQEEPQEQPEPEPQEQPEPEPQEQPEPEPEPDRVPLAVRRLQDSAGSLLGGSTRQGRTRSQTQPIARRTRSQSRSVSPQRRRRATRRVPPVAEEEEAESEASEASESGAESGASESGEESKASEASESGADQEPEPRRVPLAVRRIQDSAGSLLGGSTGRGRTRRQTRRRRQDQEPEPRRVPLAVRRIQDSAGSLLGGSTGRGRTRRQTRRRRQS